VVPLAWILRQGPLRPLTFVRGKPLYRFSSASTGAYGGSLLGLAWSTLVILGLGIRWAMSGLPVKSIDEQRFFWTRLSPDLNQLCATSCD
jgi:hypothetical protein